MTGNAELRCNTDTNKQQCEDYMLSVGTPWTMDYNRGAPDTWNVTRPINAEEAEVYGIETGLNWEFAENWKLGLNYTWTETEIKDKQLNNPVLNDTPKHMANASLKWQAADFVNLWARGEYRSERARFTSNYENLTVANQAVYDALGDYKAYTLFHIGSNFIVNDNWDVGVALYNVFDKDFNDYEKIGTGYYNRYSNTQEGRRVQLSTAFKF